MTEEQRTKAAIGSSILLAFLAGAIYILGEKVDQEKAQKLQQNTDMVRNVSTDTTFSQIDQNIPTLKL